MPQRIPDNFEVRKPRLLDNKEGPWSSTAEAIAYITKDIRAQGQVVKVLSAGSIVEYWWKDGIEDADLVAKSSGGGSGVPYTGATQNVDLGEYELKAGQIEFDQTPTGTAGVAVLRWNDTDGTLDLGLKGGNVTLQIGQEQVQRVVNKTGANLLEADYKVVRVRRVDEGGAQGQRLAIVLAQGNNDANSVDTLGLVTENINDNQEGFITTSGLVRGINTTGSLQGETWDDGDLLYLSPTTAGALTKVKPTAPQHTVVIGYVVYKHINQGKIFVKVDNGYELEELHNVTTTNYTTPIDADSVLTYDNTNSLWKRLTWANLKSTLKTYFDTLYPADSTVVHNTGTETVGGAKTFSSLLTASAGVSITPPTGSGADKVGAIVSGSNTNGGTDYLDFLKATNTAAGATNINKYFRLNSTGQIEIVNSAYTGVILTLTDSGTLNGATQAEMGYLSGVTSAIQTQINALPRVVYTNYTAETTTSTTTTNALTTFTLTISDSNWPLGGVLRLNGLLERTAGSGSVFMGLVCNGSTARYFSSAGQNMQWEWQIMKEASNTLRIGMGPSNTGNGSYAVHNQSTVTATASGGNYVFTFYMFVAAGATGSMRWMKGIMIP